MKGKKMKPLKVRHTPVASALKRFILMDGYLDNTLGWSLEKRGTELIPDKPGKSRIALVFPSEIGYPNRANFEEVVKRAKECGFGLVPKQALLQLRLDYWEQPLNEQLIVFTEPFDNDPYAQRYGFSFFALYKEPDLNGRTEITQVADTFCGQQLPTSHVERCTEIHTWITSFVPGSREEQIRKFAFLARPRRFFYWSW